MVLSDREATDLLAGQAVDAAHVRLSQALAAEWHRNPNVALVFRNELSAALRGLMDALVGIFAAEAASDPAVRDELVAAIHRRVTAFVSSRIAGHPPAVPASQALRLHEDLIAPLHTCISADFDLAVHSLVKAHAAAAAAVTGMDLEFLDREGIGAFGEVWRATDRLGRTLAVKFFHHPTATGEQELDHGRALARIEHPRVQRVIAVEMQKHPERDQPQLAIIAMFAKGQALSKVLNVSRKDVQQLGRDIIDALTAIHDAGLVHGDLHDGNVIVGDGRAMLIDVFYTHSLAAIGRENADASREDDLRSVIHVLEALLAKSEPPIARTAGLADPSLPPSPDVLEAVAAAWGSLFERS